jgi:NADPH2 dehydrogenase
MRLLLEIISEVRARHPRLFVSVRMPGQDFLEGGLTLNDTIQIAQSLENTGANILHISSGIGGWRRPTPRVGEGYLVEEAAQIQANVNVPVIGVGGIETEPYIDESLRTQRFSLAAVGRAILRDPNQWRVENLAKPHFIEAGVKRA